MSVSAAAVAKKVAAYVVTDKKALKIVGGIILGIIIIIAMPIAAVIGIFSGSVEIDTDRLYAMVSEQQTVMTEKWSAVETAMADSGYDSSRIEEAKLLFTFALSDYADSEDFTEKFVGCFSAEQTDEELIANVNSAFGTDITVDEFKNAMSETRNTYINTANCTDPTSKYNFDLVKRTENLTDKGVG